MKTRHIFHAAAAVLLTPILFPAHTAQAQTTVTVKPLVIAPVTNTPATTQTQTVTTINGPAPKTNDALLQNLNGAASPKNDVQLYKGPDVTLEMEPTCYKKPSSDPGDLYSAAAYEDKSTYVTACPPSASPVSVSAAAAAWRQMPGRAVDIGTGGGALWAIGTDAVAGGYGIYRWDGKNWATVPGGAVRIDVDGKGNAFVANDRGEMFRYTGSGWIKLPGIAKDVGIGENGTAWCIGANVVPGGYGVYRWNVATNNWLDMKGGGMRIDVDAAGRAWVVNDAGKIYFHGSSGWIEAPGLLARDIGVGADGSVFAIARDDGAVYKFNRDNRTWIKRDGQLDAITVDGRGIPFGVNAGKKIWMGYP